MIDSTAGSLSPHEDRRMVTEAMEWNRIGPTRTLCSGCSRKKLMNGKHSIEALIEFVVPKVVTAGRLRCLFWCSFSSTHAVSIGGCIAADKPMKLRL